LPPWTNQLSTLDRDLLMRHARDIPGLADRIRSVEIDAITFDDLLAMAQGAHVDVIHIDAEGHDAVIFRQIDLAAVRPSLVQLEHRHLDESEIDECVSRLRSLGYRTTFDEYDVVGVLSRAARGAGAPTE
jgi:hypothetical protein